MDKKELLKKLEEIYFNKEITLEDLEQIILNISSKKEFFALDAVIRKKYQCFDMEAGAFLSDLRNEIMKGEENA